MFSITKKGVGELKMGNQFLFPGGEIGIKLESDNYKFNHSDEPTIITARIQNTIELFQLALLKNAVEELNPRRKIILVMPYIPYARQDRVCDKGEPFSLKVFTDFINSLKFERVIVVDPHSDVAPALIDNCCVISQLVIIAKFVELNKYINIRKPLLISPDAGSNKKISKLAAFYEYETFVRADKLRNLSTGDIIETILYCDDLQGKNVLIADDICDGGRTFIELAKVLRDKNAGRISLYITHGIFSKGHEALIKGGIDEIFTTDSWGGITQHDLGSRVTVCKLADIIYL